MISAVRRRARAAAVGLIADQLLGEPAVDPHPLARFGTLMHTVERRIYADSRAPGIAHATIGVGVGLAAGRVLPSTALATYLTVAGQMLRATARSVAVPLEAGDLDAARTRLSALVGRDPWQLDEAGIARAAVESVAENTTDAVVAPALWAVFGGARGAYAYRAVNTLDAMVGHHSQRYERFGWASAKLDDAANFLPARTTAALVTIARPRRAPDVWRIVGRDGRAHPSPNSGMAEAAFAGALGVRLGGTNAYTYGVQTRPTLGDGRPCVGADIERACRLSLDVTLVLAAALFAVAP